MINAYIYKKHNFVDYVRSSTVEQWLFGLLVQDSGLMR